MPCESLDARENLPKEGPRQVAFGQLQDEVPGMSDEASTGLEQALLQARQRPTQLRMSARGPLLLPVAGYGATFSPWPPSGPPRVSPLLRRSGTGRRHNFPVFQTNTANAARHIRNRSPDRFGALVNLQTDVERPRNPWSQGSYSRNSQSQGPQKTSRDPRGNRRRALSR